MKKILLLPLLLGFAATGLPRTSRPTARPFLPDSVRIIVENDARIFRADAGWSTFLGQHLKYPNRRGGRRPGNGARNFVIDEQGRPRQCTRSQGIGYGCDEEAIRVVQLMPSWKPGTQDGKPVAVQFSLPINFRKP
jgi:protein TonB